MEDREDAWYRSERVLDVFPLPVTTKVVVVIVASRGWSAVGMMKRLMPQEPIMIYIGIASA